MTLDEMKALLQAALDDGALFIDQEQSTVLSSESGMDRLGLAVIGAILINLGDERRINIYCKNQEKMTHWAMSMQHEIYRYTRELVKAFKKKDPTALSMKTDVWNEFLNSLMREHERRGARRPPDKDLDATCAMLISKICWDHRLGNEELSAYLRVFG